MMESLSPMMEGCRDSFIPASRYLVTAEWEVLRQIAACCAERLDELQREEERLARVRRESQLAQQLIQAELRALRAQINPHFLFNSLNTIASLIASDPKKAESMTVRLAHIFHYVLTHADRPVASLEEEMNFLKTYLSIEQVRFGERLAVEFDIDPSAAGAVVPSLILQPLVENAIKHGIAPKIGRSRLVIHASRHRGMLLLSVLDDGVGVRTDGQGAQRNPPGVGLHNIRERLQTMYGHEAHLSLQRAAGGGSIAAIELPLPE
jgi:two-component system LytT family sensor kinase